MRISGDAERRVEATLEACIELHEILLNAPPRVGGGGILDGEAYHRGVEQPLNFHHRRYEPCTLAVTQRLQDAPCDIVRASFELGAFSETSHGELHTAHAAIVRAGADNDETLALERA
jgi:hypothetical protein